MQIGMGLGVGFQKVARWSTQAPPGVSYLQMDGVDDVVYMTVSPSLLVIDEVIIDCEVTVRAAFDKYFSSSHTGFLQRNGTSQDQWNGSVTAVYVDGVLGANNTAFVPLNKRIIIRIIATPASNNYFYFFANNGSGSGATAGKLYNATLKSGGVTVGHYDFTLGNVQDQSGNGRHATLTGGTWV